MPVNRNYALREDIRQYWSDRAATFDLAFGHRISPGPEFAAWQSAIRSRLGDQPLRILELACGTGEVTGVLLSLGHHVTALDFSEAMLAVAKKKHAAQAGRVRFILADAEDSREPDDAYDAIVCRHLVWTLTDPAAAFADWQRLLVPGGSLLIFDGDWSKPFGWGRLAAAAVSAIDRLLGPDPNHDGAMSDRHAGNHATTSLRQRPDHRAAAAVVARRRRQRRARLVTCDDRPCAAQERRSAKQAPDLGLSALRSTGTQAMGGSSREPQAGLRFIASQARGIPTRGTLAAGQQSA